jgi:hypothetical protein
MPDAIPQKYFPTACLDGKLFELHNFIAKKEYHRESGSSPAETDIINSALVFYNKDVVFIDPQDNYEPATGDGNFLPLERSSLAQKTQAQTVITRHIPMNVEWPTSDNETQEIDFAPLFTSFIDEILNYRNGEEGHPQVTENILIPFSTRAHGMNIFIEFYDNPKKARVTLTNSYQDGKHYGRSNDAFEEIKRCLNNRGITVDSKMNFVQFANQMEDGPCGLYSNNDANIIIRYKGDQEYLDAQGLLDFEQVKKNLLKEIHDRERKIYKEYTDTNGKQKIIFVDRILDEKSLWKSYKTKAEKVIRTYNNPEQGQQYLREYASAAQEPIKHRASLSDRFIDINNRIINDSNIAAKATPAAPTTPAAAPKATPAATANLKVTQIDSTKAHQELERIKKELALDPTSKYKIIETTPHKTTSPHHHALRVYEIQAENKPNEFTTQSTITIDHHNNFAKQELAAELSNDDLKKNAEIFVQTILACHNAPIPLKFLNGDEDKTIEYAKAIKQALDRNPPARNLIVSCSANTKLEARIKLEVFKNLPSTPHHMPSI